jgi:polyisoprenoid-binding protein YceI
MSAPTTPAVWTLDPVHSRIGFTIRHAGVNLFRSEFKHPSGTLDAAPDGTFTLRGSAAISGLDVNSEELKAHLLSPDFFDAAAHPEITFASEPFAATADGHLDLSGTLTIRGISRAVPAHGTLAVGAVDLYGNPRVGVALETTIDRRDFGIVWSADLPSGQPALADEVALDVNLAFVQQQG